MPPRMTDVFAEAGSPRADVTRRFRQLLVQHYPDGKVTTAQAAQLYRAARHDVGFENPDERFPNGKLRSVLLGAGLMPRDSTSREWDYHRNRPLPGNLPYKSKPGESGGS